MEAAGSKTGQLKAGAVLNYVVIFLNNIVGLLYTPYMLRMLGQSEYGLFSLVGSIISYLTVLDLGFTNAVIRYTAKFKAEGKEREQYEMFGMFLIIYSVIGLVALLGGVALYANIDSIFSAKMTVDEIAKLKPMFLVLLFNLVITFPMSVFVSILTAYERFVFQKILVILRIILSTVTMIVLLHYGYKAMAMVVVQTVFNVFLLVSSYIYCKKKLKIKVLFGKIRFGFFKEVGIYSFWIFLNVIMDRIYWSTGHFILGAVAGSAAVAVFGVAVRLEQMYMSFSTAVSSVFLPKLTSMVAKGNDSREISDLFIRTGRIQYCIMILVLSGFFLFGRPFVYYWAGEEYLDAYAIGLIFMVPLTVPLIQNLGITILQARNQMRFRSLAYIVIAVVSFVLQIIWSKDFGYFGCAAAVALGLVVGQIIVMNIYYYKVQKIDIPRFWKEILKMSVAPLALTAAAYFLLQQVEIDSVLKLCVAIFAYCAVYLPIFWATSMNRYEKGLVKEILARVFHLNR